MSTHNKGVSVLIILHTVGLIGMQTAYREWFLLATPIHLLLSFTVLIWTATRGAWKEVTIASMIAFALGFGAEVIGVNTGLLFGDYAYGDGLGPKTFGVPWTIGLNWAMLSLASRSVVERWLSAGWVPIGAACLMVGLDFLMEPVAPALDYWSFNQSPVPWTNYVTWLIVAWIIQWIYSRFLKNLPQYSADRALLGCQFLFFFFLLLL